MSRSGRVNSPNVREGHWACILVKVYLKVYRTYEDLQQYRLYSQYSIEVNRTKKHPLLSLHAVIYYYQTL